MAEKKLATVDAETETERRAAETQAELEAQIAELRAEIARLTENVSAIGTGAKAVVQGEAELMTKRVRERVREEPISMLLTVAGVAFLFGLFARR
jgi:septal ring factor EnvC (AmiA/AmiB activator)